MVPADQDQAVLAPADRGLVQVLAPADRGLVLAGLGQAGLVLAVRRMVQVLVVPAPIHWWLNL